MKIMCYNQLNSSDTFELRQKIKFCDTIANLLITGHWEDIEPQLPAEGSYSIEI